MGFSCLRFLSRLFRAGLGIVPFRRTLRHLRPYTFKQASWPVPARRSPAGVSPLVAPIEQPFEQRDPAQREMRITAAPPPPPSDRRGAATPPSAPARLRTARRKTPSTCRSPPPALLPPAGA